jgi:hypothetical protein
MGKTTGIRRFHPMVVTWLISPLVDNGIRKEKSSGTGVVSMSRICRTEKSTPSALGLALTEDRPLGVQMGASWPFLAFATIDRRFGACVGRTMPNWSVTAEPHNQKRTTLNHSLTERVNLWFFSSLGIDV